VDFGGVKITSTDWNYNPDNKKLTFATGTITLNDGQQITIANGHVDKPPEPGTISAGGVLEPLLVSGEELARVNKDAAKVTIEKTDWVPPEERVTVWWQVFAYLILTVAEILVSITGLELAFVAAPQSMKSFVTACWLAVVFLANLLINAPITQLYPLMPPSIYFAGLAGAMAVVTLIFLPVAARFNRSMQAEKEREAAIESTGQAT
jgi:solute carrier family 15 (oligopeptide transporter), member 1